MACAAVALLPGHLPAQAEKSAAPASSGTPGTAGSGTGKLPEYAKEMRTSDMVGLGPDGKPTGQKATYTGASKANAKAEEAMRHKMKLTKEEQAILDGKDGKEKAKLMKILVAFGNTFGAEKLVDLGGAPHSNMFIGAEYMSSMIKMLDECAKAGLKSYAPYTVGETAFGIDYTRSLNLPTGRDKGYSVAAAAVQQFEEYGTEFYLLYRLHSLDRDVAPGVQDISVGSIGARVKF